MHQSFNLEYQEILQKCHPEDATNINTSYVDVEFLKGMIVHHKQAILMSNTAERTNNKQ